MQNRKSLALQIGGAVALMMLFGTSAFAESRHQQRTGGGSGGRSDRSHSSRSNGSSQRQRSVTQSPQRSGGGERTWRNNDSQRSNTQRNNTQRFESRNDNRSRVNNSSNNNGSWRGDSRGSAWRPESRVAPSRGQSFSSSGRVERFERFHDGFRVWVGGGRFPIFVPFARWRLNPLRVGLFIRFGGFWDPLGYWSVYDYSPYDGYYNGGYYNGRYDNAYTSGEIRGVVESVDYRRGTLVINDDISRQFVTVTMPHDRSMDDVRSGDYVDFSGEWTRNGIFNAYRLERLEEGRDGRDYNRDNRDNRDDNRNYNNPY